MPMNQVQSIEEVKAAAEQVTLKRHEEMVAQEKAAAAERGYSDVEAQRTAQQATSDAAVANDTTTDDVLGNNKKK